MLQARPLSLARGAIRTSSVLLNTPGGGSCPPHLSAGREADQARPRNGSWPQADSAPRAPRPSAGLAARSRSIRAAVVCSRARARPQSPCACASPRPGDARARARAPASAGRPRKLVLRGCVSGLHASATVAMRYARACASSIRPWDRLTTWLQGARRGTRARRHHRAPAAPDHAFLAPASPRFMGTAGRTRCEHAHCTAVLRRFSCVRAARRWSGARPCGCSRLPRVAVGSCALHTAHVTVKSPSCPGGARPPANAAAERRGVPATMLRRRTCRNVTVTALKASRRLTYARRPPPPLAPGMARSTARPARPHTAAPAAGPAATRPPCERCARTSPGLGANADLRCPHMAGVPSRP